MSEPEALPVGSRVRLLPDRSLGTITGYELIKLPGREVPVPQITLDNKRVVMGYECWWEPIDSLPDAA